jgi:hypothetical protein
MATLFDTSLRIEKRMKRLGEPDFPYLNSSARPYIAAVRGILEDWYAAYPEGQDKHELRERFRKDRDDQHYGAVFELFNHALLKSMGFEVEIHPGVPNSSGKHPDFRASRNGKPLFYLECTLANPSEIDQVCQRELNRILEGLEKLKSPDFFLSPSFERRSQTPARLRELREVLHTWLAKLDPDQVERDYLLDGGDALPSFTWSDGGWEIEFQAYPRRKERRDLPGLRVVGPRSEPLVTDSDERLRQAVMNKAGRYGQLDLPYVIAVNVVADKFDEIDLMEALFGKEVFAMEVGPDGPQVKMVGRKPDGAFFRFSGLYNRGVSAVFVCDQISPGVLQRPTTLVHHPHARQKLDSSLWPLPQLLPHPSEPRLVKLDGRTAGDVMGILDPWPANADFA